MNIVVNEELKAYIDPLSADEHDALERSILAEGCRDALVLWGDVLVDGHNRYGICQTHGLPFQTVQNTRFQSLEDVHLWMIDQHLGRRSVSDFQRGVLALRKKEIVAMRNGRTAVPSANVDPHADALPASDAFDPPAGDASSSAPARSPVAFDSREAIAKAARLSSSQVVMIEKIQKQAAPELVAAVRSGTISINAAAAVSSLPVDEQVAAALGGKQELKQAAKRAREATRKPPKEDAGIASEGQSSGPDELGRLQQRVAELTEENASLRQQVADLQAALDRT